MNLRRRPSDGDLVEKYLEELEGRHASPHTLRGYRGVLERWLKSDTPARDYVVALGHTAMKAGTVNYNRAVLRAFYAWQVDNEIVDVSPLDKTKPAKAARRLQRTLTVPEVARLIDGAGQLGAARTESTEKFGHLPIEAYRSRLAAMIGLQVTAGLRVAELCSVKLDDLDMQGRTLTVIGKGDKERRVKIGRLAHRLLRDWLPMRPSAGAYLFCGAEGNPVKPDTYAQHLNEAAWWADIEYIHPHMLRHTFATLAIDSGIPVADLQVMLGHENITTTMLYVHRDKSKAWESYNMHALEVDEMEESI